LHPGSSLKSVGVGESVTPPGNRDALPVVFYDSPAALSEAASPRSFPRKKRSRPEDEGSPTYSGSEFFTPDLSDEALIQQQALILQSQNQSFQREHTLPAEEDIADMIRSRSPVIGRSSEKQQPRRNTPPNPPSTTSVRDFVGTPKPRLYDQTLPRSRPTSNNRGGSRSSDGSRGDRESPSLLTQATSNLAATSGLRNDNQRTSRHNNRRGSPASDRSSPNDRMEVD
jgi:hypothetical protein